MFKAKLGFVLVASVAFMAVLGVQGRAGAKATTDTQVFIFPFEFDTDIPCAEESVHLTGNMHVTVHTTTKANGDQMQHFISNPQGVSGVGSVSGDTYHLVGVFNEVRQGLPPGQVGVFVSVNNIIGQGPGNNMRGHSTIHFTVNANGDLTASFQHFTASCQ